MGYGVPWELQLVADKDKIANTVVKPDAICVVLVST